MTKRISLVVGAIFLLSGLVGCASKEAESPKAIAVKTDPYHLVGEKSFLTGYEPLNADSTVNMVVEIPTGTTAKWEVDKSDGSMRWEFRNGKPRVVQYLGYPGNYGMIPQTSLPKEQGGDGDPLDIIVLGDPRPRGSVVRARLLGVLKLLDNNEQDDKLIAVMADTPLEAANNLLELNERFPGVTAIVETWFQNYKGAGVMQSLGYGEVAEARAILATAIKSFQE